MYTSSSVVSAAAAARKGRSFVRRRRAICFAVVLGIGGISFGAQAATFAPGDVLTIDPAVVTHPVPSISAITAGSWFSMGGAAGTKTALAPGVQGLVIGTVQNMGGYNTHSGSPSTVPGDSANINAPWAYFGNTGKNFTTVAVTGSTTAGLDLSGWTVSWNGISVIPMGAGAWGTGFSSGVGNITWDGVIGDPYTLDYHATVPSGDPSGFGGVQYALHLTGLVTSGPAATAVADLGPAPPPAPPAVKSSVGTVSPGATAVSQGLSKPLMTKAQLTSAGVPSDPGIAAGTMCSGGCFDFKDTGVTAGATAKIVLTLNAGIPKNAVFRKYNPATSTWGTFDTSKGDWVKSAPLTSGACPAPGATAYTSGLTTGDYCVELGIKDGGSNDMSSTSGVIADPSGVGVSPSTAGTGTGTGAGTVPLPTGAILKIAPGVVACLANAGTPPLTCTYGTNVPTGSYFAMDMNGNGSFQATEKTPLAPGPDGGVIMGQTQSASGSHSGVPNGTEHASIDAPWSFFGNTGLDYTTVAPSVLTNDGAGHLTLNWKGWTVTWNGIPTIPMGGDKKDNPTPPTGYPTADSGVATLTCSTPACANGDTFVLDSYAHVPNGDPSGFGGVFYDVHLVGTIMIPPPPAVKSSVGTVSPGATAVGQGLSKPLMTKAQLASAGVPSDPGIAAGTMCSGGCFDFKDTGVTAGATAKIVLTLTAGIPKNAVFRKYNPTTSAWSTFDTSKGDWVKSAPFTSGACPAPGATAYTSGLTTGDYCVELGIKDGGPNDMSLTAGVIADPSGVGVLPSVTGTGVTLPSGTGGCSISPTPVSAWHGGAWWLTGGLLGWLGFSRRRRSSRQS